MKSGLPKVSSATFNADGNSTNATGKSSGSWMRTAIAADLIRFEAGSSWRSILLAIWRHRTLRPIIMHRWANHESRLRPLFRLAHRVTLGHAGMDFPLETEVGRGLAITHGWGLVVSPEARIGSNVTLFHGVTLGTRTRTELDGTRVHGAPTIGDEVWIGPHAVLVGPVVVGRGSIIAPGAMVLDDVPEYSLVVGNPQRIARKDVFPDVPNRAV
jgi:serine O-acetyltransferase